MKYEIMVKPGYRALGLKWDGAYSEIPSLKETISKVFSRRKELEHAVEPDVQLGLSYHLRPDGFVHYSVYEVSEEQSIPEGMVEIRVPEMTYLITHHEKGQDIGQTYMGIAEWLKESDYKPFQESDKEYFDSLPIKHERYPDDRDLTDPHFDILIPVVERTEA
ncbi:GyrI-like domain-containing protein [Radiobacillus kanasensis]|uniref:GyrI-like domain-containing protein n=1 Tax=Radiobacillus kanasensis TaxID=2844358 RepID=UPI001E296BF9|nr:GyrI-like domain-containing protein [Radiobacillus kanasensis]UFT99578.1 GyrI-like domain-containing protein [Radiobacillus kanasensis]